MQSLIAQGTMESSRIFLAAFGLLTIADGLNYQEIKFPNDFAEFYGIKNKYFIGDLEEFCLQGTFTCLKDKETFEIVSHFLLRDFSLGHNLVFIPSGSNNLDVIYGLGEAGLFNTGNLLPNLNLKVLRSFL